MSDRAYLLEAAFKLGRAQGALKDAKDELAEAMLEFRAALDRAEREDGFRLPRYTEMNGTLKLIDDTAT